MTSRPISHRLDSLVLAMSAAFCRSKVSPSNRDTNRHRVSTTCRTAFTCPAYFLFLSSLAPPHCCVIERTFIRLLRSGLKERFASFLFFSSARISLNFHLSWSALNLNSSSTSDSRNARINTRENTLSV